MANIKHIQFPQYLKNADKKTAIAALEAKLNETPNDFVNGEEVILEYEEQGVICSASAIINKKNGNIKIFVALNEFETVKIVESENEPEDKESLWLSDTGESGETSDLRGQVKALSRQLLEMTKTVNELKEALSNTLGGGELLDSTKYDLENRSQQEQPIESKYYATGDTRVTDIGLYIADVSLDEYAKDESPYRLYRDSLYSLQLKFMNEKGEEIKETPELAEGISLFASSHEATVEIKEYNTVNANGLGLTWRGEDGGYPSYVPPQRILSITEATNSGYTTIIATVTLEDGQILQKTYNTPFLYEQEPDTGVTMPKHLLVKHADKYETITSRSDYLCVYEFVWCIENNSLYLKAEASNGSIQLFKINGQGSDPVPTGDTSGITYIVSGTNIEATDRTSAITIDGDYMVIPNARVENGYLILNDSGGGGEETVITLDGDFLKCVNAEIDSNGFLHINSNKIKVENEIMII